MLQSLLFEALALLNFSLLFAHLFHLLAYLAPVCTEKTDTFNIIFCHKGMHLPCLIHGLRFAFALHAYRAQDPTMSWKLANFALICEEVLRLARWARDLEHVRLPQLEQALLAESVLARQVSGHHLLHVITLIA